MTTGTQQHHEPRWALVFLAAFVVALAAILLGTTASASAAGVAETRVGASSVVIEPLVGPPEHISAGHRLGNEPVRVVTTVATGVAAKAVVPSPNSGIYVINSSNGVYVGQSGNITRRLAAHVRTGKFTQAEVDAAARQGVVGGKTQREIAEQLMLDRIGRVGDPGILNRVNPIGPRRFSLMPDQPYIR